MENVNFSALAPRMGSRPMMSTWSDLGTSSMNGGAFNWGSIWSGLKSFGSTAKRYGNKLWNSSTGTMLRQKLKDTKAQEKLVEGLASGVHGALDIANQEIAKAIEKRLDRPTTLPEVEPDAQVEELIEESKEIGGKKRPIDTEEEVITTQVVEPPPSYEEIFGTKEPAPLPLRPTTRPIPSMVRPVLPPPTLPPVVDTPTTLELAPPSRPTSRPPAPPAYTPPAPSASFGPRGWQSTLQSIVGAGVRSVKRRRCYR